MGVRHVSRTIIIALFLFYCPSASAIPDRTMSITPTASAGSTITASDENTRNNEVSTQFNNHDHADIDTTTSNTFTIGNNASGTKTYAIDNQFTSTPSIRYSDTLERWEIIQDGSNVDVKIKDEQIIVGDGTSGAISVLGVDNQFTTTPAIRYSDTAERWEFSNNASTFTALSGATTITPAIGSFTRDTTSVSGTQAITGVGFQPSLLIFFATQDSAAGEASWGMSTATTDQCLADRANVTAGTYQADGSSSIDDIEGAGVEYEGQVSSMDSDGFTVTWTKTGAPSGTLTIYYAAYR